MTENFTEFNNNAGLSVSKYLKAITAMNGAIGKLDVLRLHLQSAYNDNMSNEILTSVCRELAGVCGVDYKPMANIEPSKPVEPQKPYTIQITEQEEPKEKQTIDYSVYRPTNEPNAFQQMYYNNDIEYYRNQKNNNTAYAQAQIQKEEIKQDVQTKVKTNNLVFDRKNNTLDYTFINSSNLLGFVYNKNNNTLQMTFKQNGRTYEYYKVPNFMITNLISYDERGMSAGGYFNQNIVNNENIKYKEITNDILIG